MRGGGCLLAERGGRLLADRVGHLLAERALGISGCDIEAMIRCRILDIYVKMAGNRDRALP
jgi:hypothetical protein